MLVFLMPIARPSCRTYLREDGMADLLLTNRRSLRKRLLAAGLLCQWALTKTKLR